MRAVEQVVLFCALTTLGALAAANSTCAESTDGDEQSALVLSLSLSANMSGLPSFTAFIQEHGRTYEHGSQEYHTRREIYTQSLQTIQRQNGQVHRRWDAGVNHLSDRTEVELKQLLGSRPIHAGSTPAHLSEWALNQESSFVIPEEKIWTSLASVKAASDQGSCGSCWAVATATALSANAEIKGYPHHFSAQELIDCVPNEHHCGGKGGCTGSTVELAMNWVMEEGLAQLKETPYRGQDMKCKKKVSLLEPNGHNDHKTLEDMIAIGTHKANSASSSGLALGLKDWERLPANEYAPLLRAVAEHGPVAVSVGAGSFFAYSSGVFDKCSPGSVIDHAVALVGYGTDKKTKDKFWMIKNSWGSYWGEKGFIRLLRTDGEEANGHCGWDNAPQQGTGCDGGPKKVKVCGMCGILYDSVVPHFHKK